MSALNVICTNGSLREFMSAPFIDVDVTERTSAQPFPEEQAFLRVTGFQAPLIPLFAAAHFWGLAFVVIPSLFS